MQFVDTVTPSGFQYTDQFNQLGKLASNSPFWNKRDEQTVRDYQTMYYQNAWNAAMLNYQNEYNSPLQQMLRYQEAGLSPWQVTDSGNIGSAPSGAAPKGSSAGSPSETDWINSANQSVNTLNQTLNEAQKLYDYISYGRDISSYKKEAAYWDSILSQYRAGNEGLENDWQMYWNLGAGANYPQVSSSPRAKYMEFSTQQKAAQVKQLEGLVDTIYPSQKAANEARTALAQFQLALQEGQKGAILQIDTGYPTLDAVLKMVAFWILNR